MNDQVPASRPQCPLCGNGEFRQEEGKIDSKWGATAHKVIILSCSRCGHILLFSRGRTIWDFD